jgi:hypothetical protein
MNMLQVINNALETNKITQTPILEKLSHNQTIVDFFSEFCSFSDRLYKKNGAQLFKDVTWVVSFVNKTSTGEDKTFLTHKEMKKLNRMKDSIKKEKKRTKSAKRMKYRLENTQSALYDKENLNRLEDMWIPEDRMKQLEKSHQELIRLYELNRTEINSVNKLTNKHDQNIDETILECKQLRVKVKDFSEYYYKSYSKAVQGVKTLRIKYYEQINKLEREFYSTATQTKKEKIDLTKLKEAQKREMYKSLVEEDKERTHNSKIIDVNKKIDMVSSKEGFKHYFHTEVDFTNDYFSEPEDEELLSDVDFND